MEGGLVTVHRRPVCTNCGIVIRWQPTLVDGRSYCCPGCAQGGPCECDYENLPQAGEVKPMVVADSGDSLPARYSGSGGTT
jgi:hypothetical protein